jgi:5,10-methenyltetrahydrofolate synthetase
MSSKDERQTGCYASPPCFMHELDRSYLGLSDGVDEQQRTDVARWRKAERARLIAARLALSPQAKKEFSERIAAILEHTIGDVAGLIIGVYWPINDEPDLRNFMARIAARGARCALPIGDEQKGTLRFRNWTPGQPLENGPWHIPIPVGGDEVVPNVVIFPVVGFDPKGYRLGYGRGSVDRTLAATQPKPRVFGVGYTQAAIETIYPQPHDVPMDAIVTEACISLPPPNDEDGVR